MTGGAFSASLRWPRHVAGAIVACATGLAAMAQIIGQTAAIFVGCVFFLAGLAHGAGQEDRDSLRPYGVAEAAAYVMLAAGFAGLFIVAPLAALAAFLALSAWHFAQNAPARGREGAADIALALVTIGASALLWPTTTQMIFSALTGEAIPRWFISVLAVMGVIGIGLTCALALLRARGAIAAVTAVAAAALFHPVLAVGYAFFAFHALPETLRQIDRFGARATLRAVLPTMAIALVGAGIVAILLVLGALTLPAAAALALGMITPHMLAGDLRD